MNEIHASDLKSKECYPANQFLNHGNYLAYGLDATAS